MKAPHRLARVFVTFRSRFTNFRLDRSYFANYDALGCRYEEQRMRVISKARLSSSGSFRATRTPKGRFGRGIRTSTAGPSRGNLGEM